MRINFPGKPIFIHLPPEVKAEAALMPGSQSISQSQERGLPDRKNSATPSERNARRVVGLVIPRYKIH